MGDDCYGGLALTRQRPISTFSIAAYDPIRQEWGVAVQSKFMAVGAVVSWARADAGAVATRSYADLTYGPRGLELMALGLSAEATVNALTEADDGRDQRQLRLIDRRGNAAAFTGRGCHEWAGHIVGEGFTCQGNILVPGTVEAMAVRFESVRGGEGELADWLVDALAAGQEAGGDSRGRQAAAVLVVRADGGYGGNNDRYLDLRVDDNPYPIQELQRLVDMHHLYFGVVKPEDEVLLTDISVELQTLLTKSGHYNGPIDGQFGEISRAAMRALVGTENLEERWDGVGDSIDRLVVDFLTKKYG